MDADKKYLAWKAEITSGKEWLRFAAPSAQKSGSVVCCENVEPSSELTGDGSGNSICTTAGGEEDETLGYTILSGCSCDPIGTIKFNYSSNPSTTSNRTATVSITQYSSGGFNGITKTFTITQVNKKEEDATYSALTMSIDYYAEGVASTSLPFDGKTGGTVTGTIEFEEGSGFTASFKYVKTYNTGESEIHAYERQSDGRFLEEGTTNYLSDAQVEVAKAQFLSQYYDFHGFNPDDYKEQFLWDYYVTSGSPGNISIYPEKGKNSVLTISGNPSTTLGRTVMFRMQKPADEPDAVRTLTAVKYRLTGEYEFSIDQNPSSDEQRISTTITCIVDGLSDPDRYQLDDDLYIYYMHRTPNNETDNYYLINSTTKSIANVSSPYTGATWSGNTPEESTSADPSDVTINDVAYTYSKTVDTTICVKDIYNYNFSAQPTSITLTDDSIEDIAVTSNRNKINSAMCDCTYSETEGCGSCDECYTATSTTTIEESGVSAVTCDIVESHCDGIWDIGDYTYTATTANCAECKEKEKRYKVTYKLDFLFINFPLTDLNVDNTIYCYIKNGNEQSDIKPLLIYTPSTGGIEYKNVTFTKTVVQ